MFNQQRINEIQEFLLKEEVELEKKLSEIDHAPELEEQRSHNRRLQVEYGRIVSRYLETLPKVTRKVFVSTHFDSDGFANQWVRDVIGLIKKQRKDSALPRYHFVYGHAEGKLIREDIVQKIISCHYFLTIALDRGCRQPGGPTESMSQEKDDVSHWLVEELALAAILPKLVVIAVDQNLPHLIFGEFLGNDLGRIIFNKLDPDADERLANRLLEALDIAPVVQAREIERKRQVWKTFDF